MKNRETNLKHVPLTMPKSLVLLLVTGFLFAPTVNAEVTVGVFAGQSFIDNGDLNLTQGNTNLNYKNVS